MTTFSACLAPAALGAVLACLLAGPAIAQDAPPPVPVPRSELLTIESTTLGRTYDLYVGLPPGYAAAENEDRRYPVLYMNDGPYFFATATGIGYVPMATGYVEPYILVGVSFAHGSTGPDSRVLDYTPTLNPEWDRQTGGAEAYLEFLETEAIPLIETTYRADPERRAIAGHSLSGLFGAHALFSRPELFDGYIISSPSLWFHNEGMFETEAAFAETHDDLDAQVYLGIGSLEHPHRYRGMQYEMVEHTHRFAAALESRGYPSLEVRAREVDGAIHETAYSTTFLNGMLWLYANDRDIPWGY
ncbi:MAG: alpha/beta hydrolase-fold protein [Maricaulaceae bacterium]|jgi:predicted alpha/beta superfamily hydrolase